LTEIPRRRGLTVEAFLREYGVPQRPVIIEDATTAWPAMTTWTFDHFARRHADVAVTVARNAGAYGGPPRAMTVGEYFRYMRIQRDTRPYYLASWNFSKDCPDLLTDFTVPPYFADDWFLDLPEDRRPRLTWLFIGPARSGSWLHLDVGHTSAWNVQVVGRKRWRLFPPEQSPLLYNGQVDAFNPDYERFPLSAQAEPLECVLGPGEIIFTPSLWYHQTLAIEDGIAVTANYVDHTNADVVLEWLRANRDFTAGQGLPHLAEDFAEVVERRRAGLT